MLWKKSFHSVENPVAALPRRQSRVFRHMLGAGAVALASFCLPPPLLAATAPAQLMIGQGEAWVREFFPPSGERDIEHIA